MIRKAQEEDKTKIRSIPISGASPGDPDYDKKEALARKAKELEAKKFSRSKKRKRAKRKIH